MRAFFPFRSPARVSLPFVLGFGVGLAACMALLPQRQRDPAMLEPAAVSVPAPTTSRVSGWSI